MGTNQPLNLIPNDDFDSPYDSTVSEQLELAKLISEAAVRDCILIKTRAARKGRHLSLRDIAVMRGYITNAELSQSMPVVMKRHGEAGSTLYTQGQLTHMVSSWLEEMGLTCISSCCLADTDGGAAMPRYKPGQMLGDFRLIEVVGAGPLAVVYKAVSMKAGKLCCLKVYESEAFPTKMAARRFKARSRRALKLRHPYIPKGYAIGELKKTGEIVYVFQYLEGVSLERILSTTKMIREKVALAMCIQIADALGCCHEKGIMHANLKPSNVLITKSGHVFLLDAGLERASDRASRKLRAGEPVCAKLAESLPYINPSLAGGDDELYPQDDIYSLGALFYRMMCGRAPFEGAATEVVERIANARFPAFDTQNIVISTPTRFVIAKMTRRDRDDRYKDMPIVTIELQRSLGQLEQVHDEGSSVKNVFQSLDNAIDSLTAPDEETEGEPVPKQARMSDKIADLLSRYQEKLDQHDAPKSGAAGTPDGGGSPPPLPD